MKRAESPRQFDVDAVPSDEVRADPLDSWVRALRQPVPASPFQDEPALARSVELASSVLSPASATLTDAPTIDAAVPTSIGPYRLLERLGQGGMGTVWKALHPRLDKVVAVKVLAPDRLANAEMVARFQREMKAVGWLDHPHVVRALDAGEAEGVPYLVMEYVAGIDLAALLKRLGPLPVPEACELVRQAALGLEAAHARGLVHRDVKPANLMLATQDHGPPPVKVLDLGVAGVMGSAETGEAELTGMGQILGTVDYMAPEQADARQVVDTRADVWSLGATLYALLTGGTLFSAAAPRTLLQKLAVLAHEPIPPVRGRRGDVSKRLARVIERMLARDPSQRYATMTETAAALRPFTAGADLAQLSKLSPGSIPVREARARHSRRRGILALLGGTGLGLATVLVLFQFARQQPERTPTGTPVATTSPEDSQRRAAEWVLSIGPGTSLSVFTADGRYHMLRPGDPLPTGPLRLRHIQLDLDQAGIAGDAFPDLLAQHLHGVPLTLLLLRTESLTPAGVRKLTALTELAELQTLSINGASANDATLVELRKWPRLGNLDMHDAGGITEKGLTALGECKELTNLGLVNSRISAQGLQALQGFARLNYLNLHGTPCTAEHLEALTRLKVTHLVLIDCGITDAKAKHLSRMPGLTNLGLSHNPLTDQGLRELKQLKELKELVVGHTGVTAAGVAELQAALPDCKVTGLRP